ncbi:MAG: OsmC family protein [Rhodobacteraceae bacterium]|jgi:hypothetical protein|nr:OsmC family protein [Paracoccaceae bacterium]
MPEYKKPEPLVRQGLDIEKFREFRAFAAENPQAVIFGLEASGTAEGRAVHTLASTGAYTLGGQRIERIARRYSYHFGAHREVEEALGFVDPTDREQETEVALAALAGCINAVVTVSAAERGIDLATSRTDIAITWDPAVFLHLRDTEEQGAPVDQFEGFTVTLAVSGERLDESDIEFLRRTVARSAVFNLFTLARHVRVEVERIDHLEAAA